MKNDDVSEVWIWAAILAVAAGILCGLAVFAYQAYWWLRMSYWFSISIITGLRWLDVSWARAPWDWLGLHALLDFIPLSLALPIVGLVAAGMIMQMAKEP